MYPATIAEPLTNLRDIALSPISLSSMSLVMLFYGLAPFFPDRKRLSWVLTTASSCTMSVISIPFLWDYLENLGSLENVRASPELAVTTSRFFQAYLFFDLVLGYLYYRPHITLLAGWIHHPVYVMIVELSIRRSWSHLFCLAASMELPTFLLGIANLFPQLRSDILFAMFFFATRILFHIVLGVSLLSEENRNSLTDGSYIPAVLFLLIFPLHLTWFVRCIKGFVRRTHKTTPLLHSAFFRINLVPGPSLSLSEGQSTRPSVDSPISKSFQCLLHRLSRRSPVKTWASQLLRYDFTVFTVPLKTELVSIFNLISPYIPHREIVSEWSDIHRRLWRVVKLVLQVHIGQL